MPLSSLSAEDQLLLSCARPVPGEPGAFSPDLDWGHVLRKGMRHGLAPLLYRSLKRAGGVSAGVLSASQRLYFSAIQRSLPLDAELRALAPLFREAGVDLLPIKGPLLARLAYGGTGLRTFIDLDVLVRRDQFFKAKELLEARGYVPFRAMTEAEEEAHLDTQLGYEFVDRKRRLIVEVHWQFLHSVHHYEPDVEAVWQRAETVEIDGVSVRTLSPEDLLLYLCAHGSRHYWDRLLLVADVAHALHANQNRLDIERLLRLAREAHGLRMLYLGAALAGDLLGAPVPEALRIPAHHDTEVRAMQRQVEAWYFDPSADPADPYARARFHLNMRERFRDRIPYLRHLAKLALNR